MYGADVSNQPNSVLSAYAPSDAALVAVTSLIGRSQWPGLVANDGFDRKEWHATCCLQGSSCWTERDIWTFLLSKDTLCVFKQLISFLHYHQDARLKKMLVAMLCSRRANA